MKQIFKKNLQDINDTRSGKTDWVDWLNNNKDWGYTLEELGLTEEDLMNPDYHYKVNDNEEEILNKQLKKENFGKETFKVINLYKYVSDFYGASNISDESRDFCKNMVELTKFGRKLLTFNDIVAFNSSQPGMGKGGSNSYSVFNYRGGVNCKHHWLKWKFDTVGGQLVKAPDSEQQGWIPVTSQT